MRFLCIIFFIFFGFAIQANAYELSFDGADTGMSGAQLPVSAVLSLGTTTANAIEGTIVVGDTIAVEYIDDSASAISFWLEKPKEHEGTIRFSGIAPGGFSGDVHLFRLFLEQKGGSTGTLAFTSGEVLAHDGVGTSLPGTLGTKTITFQEKGVSGAPVVSHDDELPEMFTPLLIQDPDLFSGAHTLIFKTDDKGSGIKEYKVREGFFDWYRVGESPYKLRFQDTHQTIYVKAIDHFGNERIATLYPRESRPFLHTNFIILVMLCMCLSLAFFVFLRWRR